LKAGLDRGEAAVHIASPESPSEIKEAMERFGIEVDRLGRSGVLHVLDYRDCYIIRSKFSISRTIAFWKRLLNESLANGLKGLRAAGEMACFFEKGMVKELVEYERALRRVFELPMTGICAYDTNVVVKEGRGELFLDLIKAHGVVIIIGPQGGVVKTK